ncbi:hypothetical protein B0T16DRAFT_389904 [Cercophora newfieldiana]|uniref:Secreted protein n=1 Tax=Cercophora newfieldiana TaxID=92897 RepID=A0AA39YEC4_9PEZI|nr:hypothetical protein B0T16DRAFT_389904 [Cercophora newfieldiana]
MLLLLLPLLLLLLWARRWSMPTFLQHKTDKGTGHGGQRWLLPNRMRFQGSGLKTGRTASVVTPQRPGRRREWSDFGTLDSPKVWATCLRLLGPPITTRFDRNGSTSPRTWNALQMPPALSHPPPKYFGSILGDVMLKRCGLWIKAQTPILTSNWTNYFSQLPQVSQWSVFHYFGALVRSVAALHQRHTHATARKLGPDSDCYQAR